MFQSPGGSSMSLNKALTWISPDLSILNTIYWLPTERDGVGPGGNSALPFSPSQQLHHYFILPLSVSL